MCVRACVRACAGVCILCMFVCVWLNSILTYTQSLLDLGSIWALIELDHLVWDVQFSERVLRLHGIAAVGLAVRARLWSSRGADSINAHLKTTILLVAISCCTNSFGVEASFVALCCKSSKHKKQEFPSSAYSLPARQCARTPRSRLGTRIRFLIEPLSTHPLALIGWMPFGFNAWNEPSSPCEAANTLQQQVVNC